MASVIQILELLESNNSRLFKEEVLEQNIRNVLLRRVFVATFDPYVNYFVSKFKMPKLSGKSSDDDAAVTDFLNFITDDLSTRKLTGNAAKDAVIAKFASFSSENLQKWCLRILLKNLRCGVSENTINKIWPKSINRFSVQLAEMLPSRFEAGRGIVLTEPVKYPVRVEPKLDGLRCIAVKHAGVVTLFTRSGTQLETLPRIKAALEAAPYDDIVLDGESLGETWNDSASVMMSHKTAKDDSNIVFHVFDAVPYEDWKSQTSADLLEERVQLVNEMVRAINSPAVRQVDGTTVSNDSDLMSFYKECMDKGYEGVMIKNLSTPYLFKRSNSVMKMKPVSTFEGIVISHYEGNRGSKREGLWGGFNVLMTNGITTKVGGGFTDALKAEIDMDPNAWIGKILEVEGQPDPLTDDGFTKDGKVRFPVFVRQRDRSDVDPALLEAYEVYSFKNPK